MVLREKAIAAFARYKSLCIRMAGCDAPRGSPIYAQLERLSTDLDLTFDFLKSSSRDESDAALSLLHTLADLDASNAVMEYALPFIVDVMLSTQDYKTVSALGLIMMRKGNTKLLQNEQPAMIRKKVASIVLDPDHDLLHRKWCYVFLREFDEPMDNPSKLQLLEHDADGKLIELDYVRRIAGASYLNPQ